MSPPISEILKKRKAGRPREYDSEIIAQEMLEWVKDEDSINIAQFCADRGYLPSLIWRTLPPAFAATIGNPTHIASRTTSEYNSSRLGKTKISIALKKPTRSS